MITPRRGLVFVAACSLLFSSAALRAAEPPTPAAILQDLRSFQNMGSVLYIAAHPDDENTLLIAYLARGKNYRTAYLSITRGDGGQNLLGPDLGAKLGVARTQELLAARRLDGGRQFFTRAIDFGFSKDYRETLNIWGKDDVLSDVVRVIRTFRPDVVINRFSTHPGNTHGHHTASAVLGLAAFKLAGDPKVYPDQLKTLQPWQPKRIFMNGRGGEGAVHLEISGEDPVSGLSFSELAAHSRAMHKTQGFDRFTFRGGRGTSTESFELLAGDPATNDIFDGIDTTWARIPGGADIGKLAGEIIAQFNPEKPAASVPALLILHKQLAALQSTDPLVTEKRTQLDRIIQHCLGLEVQTTIPQPEYVPGEELPLHSTVKVRADVPVRWVATHYPSIDKVLNKFVDLTPNETATRNSNQTLPRNTLLTQPYWLRAEGTPGLFHVDDPSLIGRPENPPVFPIQQVFEVGGETLVIADAPVAIEKDPNGKETSRRLDVIPPVSIHFNAEVALFAPGSSHPVEIELTAARANSKGTLQLETPSDWKVTPAQHSFDLAQAGDKTQLTFTVTAPAQSTTAKIGAVADIGGTRYRNDRYVIHYSHIPLQLLQPVAALKCLSLDLAVHGRKIGYIQGAGDSVDACLRQMGCTVTELTTNDLTPGRLKDFDAIVTGVRLFDTHRNLGDKLSALFDYVQNGGTVVMQYNRVDGLESTPLTLKISQLRVTDEHAPVTFLAPDSPVLNTPNKITSADFDNWVQERGTYFPNQWDSHFTPILACNDPGESPLKGSLLVADYGKGHFVYTGLTFFRQLPAGVPGAYRLFANLISLGK
ncbi:MAG TPA: PIG-L family deacetylase [Candidatus Angelobacter sp.]|nr:PIG-L family deacetylase [Candidatus Angelobacter sp.]